MQAVHSPFFFSHFFLSSSFENFTTVFSPLYCSCRLYLQELAQVLFIIDIKDMIISELCFLLLGGLAFAKFESTLLKHACCNNIECYGQNVILHVAFRANLHAFPMPTLKDIRSHSISRYIRKSDTGVIQSSYPSVYQKGRFFICVNKIVTVFGMSRGS